MEIVSILIGALGLGFGIYTYLKQRKERLHRQQRFEWNHIYQGVRQLCKWLKRDSFIPDFIVTVPGAGGVLATLASIELGEQVPVYLCHQKSIGKDQEFIAKRGEFVETAKWVYRIPDEVVALTNKKLILLDDYAQSGQTLKNIKDKLIESGFPKENIRSAALISVVGLKESNMSPDYTWFWVDSYDVHMPWGHASSRVRMGEFT